MPQSALVLIVEVVLAVLADNQADKLEELLDILSDMTKNLIK
ncbi:MAG: hypothetical protein ACW964_11610 [Candidatus Hodarchaeales archaeon]|jgi:hypothetical protein